MKQNLQRVFDSLTINVELSKFVVNEERFIYVWRDSDKFNTFVLIYSVSGKVS